MLMDQFHRHRNKPVYKERFHHQENSSIEGLMTQLKLDSSGPGGHWGSM